MKEENPKWESFLAVFFHTTFPKYFFHCKLLLFSCSILLFIFAGITLFSILKNNDSVERNARLSFHFIRFLSKSLSSVEWATKERGIGVGGGGCGKKRKK